MEKEIFLKSLNSLESSFGEKISGDRAKIYWDILKGYSDIDIKKAVVKSVRELKFFPKVSEIIEAIEGSQEDEAEVAWLSLLKKMENRGHYQSVSFSEYPAIGAVVEALGGWLKICEMKYDEEKWVKEEFIKLYPIMKRRGEYPDKLIGQFELDNGNKYTEKYMLEKYGRRLDGKKVDRERVKIEGGRYLKIDNGDDELEVKKIADLLKDKFDIPKTAKRGEKK
jgi:hypothetical protein